MSRRESTRGKVGNVDIISQGQSLRRWPDKQQRPR